MPGWEAGKDLGLPREPGEALWVSREGVGEDLQRDLAVELRVGRLPDLAHAAFPEEGGDVVVPEAGARVKSHHSLAAVLVTRSDGPGRNDELRPVTKLTGTVPARPNTRTNC